MTALCFIDTETTSLRHDRRAWEIGVIRRYPVTVKHPNGPDTSKMVDDEHQWFIQAENDNLDLANADPMSLKIGRFYDRHPQFATDEWWVTDMNPEEWVLREVERLTRGAHLVGNVVSFDAEVLATRMRANGICPSWHYHLIDIEPMAVGYLDGMRARQNQIYDGYPVENDGKMHPGLVRWNERAKQTDLPWDSEQLSRALGIEPPGDEERHTALGDARWVMRMWDAITGGRS